MSTGLAENGESALRIEVSIDAETQRTRKEAAARRSVQDAKSCRCSLLGGETLPRSLGQISPLNREAIET